MNILYDTAGETYTIMRIRAKAGESLQYEMRPEFGSVPDSLVVYHSGKLHRFCPDGQPCNPQGAALPTDPFNKIGTYNFIVSGEAVWDCISPMAAFPHRVVAEGLTDSGTVGGDVYVSAGEWELGDRVLIAPVLIRGVPESTSANRLSETGVLLHHIRTEPLEA